MPSKNQSILLGAAVYTVAGLITAFLSVNGGQSAQYVVSALCCLAALAGPFTAVWHYTSTNNLTVPAGTGAGIGAAAVVLGGIVSYAVTKLLQVAGIYPSDAEMIEQQRDQMISQGMEPEAVDQAMGFAEMFQGIGGFAINLVIAAVIGAIGGAIAASIFKKGTADYEV